MSDRTPTTNPGPPRGPVYAGIGSRRTPPDTLAEIRRLAAHLAARGWHLATGGANGADAAFADGAGPAARTLYIPWRGYNGLAPTAPDSSPCAVIVASAPEHLAVAARHHPAWHRCRQGARKLHGRNSAIVLGAGLDTPVDAVICWTPGGRLEGGTALGIRIATAHGIPVHNLAVTSADAVRDILLGHAAA